MNRSTTRRVLAAACGLGLALALIIQAPDVTGRHGGLPTSAATVGEGMIARPGAGLAAGSSWNGAASDEGTLNGGLNAI